MPASICKEYAMGQAITAAIPVPAPAASRVLDELSGKIGKIGPTALNKFDELSGHLGKMAPAAFNEYVRDFCERTLLFLDILRQRGNQREGILAHQATSVLIYDSELVMRGDELPHPM
jgi:hypothetical protein